MWHLFHLVLVALLYFLAGKLGLSLPYVGDKVTLFWLPTGIAVAALLRWRWWGSLPGIFIGSCAVTLSVDGQWGVSLGVGVGNTLAPAVCVLLLRHWAFSPSFERRLDALKFCAASGISMLLSATIGTLVLWLANNIENAQFVDVWRVWWLGDALGVLLAAPAMLSLSRASWSLVLEQRTEFLVWWIVAVVIGLVAFIGNRVSEGYALPLAFLPMPLAVWAALRFGLMGASLATLWFSCLAVWSTSLGAGPFFLPDLRYGQLSLVMFSATLASLALMITAVHGEIRQAADELRDCAFYDALTRLANRRLLVDRLRQVQQQMVRSHHFGALLFIDLDHFKALNDAHGHDVGDEMLCIVAQRLRSCLREADTAARLGGDEFIIMLSDLGQDRKIATLAAQQVAEKIRTALDTAYALSAGTFSATPSIGITVFSGPQYSVDQLLKQADLAMYAAKSAGRNTVRVYTGLTEEAQAH